MPFSFRQTPTSDHEWFRFNQIIDHDGPTARRLPTTDDLWQSWVRDVAIDTKYKRLPIGHTWRAFLIEQEYI